MLHNLILFMVLMGLKLRESFIIGRLLCYSEPIKFLYLHESLSRLKYLDVCFLSDFLAVSCYC